MTFYTKVLANFANDPTLALNVNFNVSPADGLSQEKIDETRASLRDLGLNESFDLEEKETGTDN